MNRLFIIFSSIKVFEDFLNEKVEMSCKPSYKRIETLPFNTDQFFSYENFISALNYNAKDDDLFIVSFPKCGSTWTQYIVYLIINNCVPLDKEHKMSEYIPFFEADGALAVEKLPSPRVIKTHLSYDMIPKNSNSKYIFIARNPKDCVVSFYYHTKGFKDAYNFTDGKFDDYFELFINGQVDYGDYFQHLLSWLPHSSEQNILFLTYESMKRDSKSAIFSIANFIGKKYFDLLSENINILDNVLKYSDVESMKKEDNRWYMSQRVENTKFVRKGIIGDWKNHLTEEQSKRIDKKIVEHLEGSKILRLWINDI